MESISKASCMRGTVSGTTTRMKPSPEFFRAGGFAIPFEEVYAWMRRCNYQFKAPPPYTDELDVLRFAESVVPHNLCIQVLIEGDDDHNVPEEVIYVTRVEYVPPSIIRADLWRPTPEPFEMHDDDLPMRNWLLKTAGALH
jgi:hypothetical protein